MFLIEADEDVAAGAPTVTASAAAAATTPK